MTNEYSIACLLTPSSVEKLRLFSFIDKKNYPHISLFQFKCCDAKLLNLFKAKIKEIKVSTQFKTINITPVENNLFLNIEDDSTLQSASDYLSEIYCESKLQKGYLSQIDFSLLDSNQIKLAEKYGIYWIKDRFNPHVTLQYDKNDGNKLSVDLPQIIQVEPPSIHPIDEVGRIILRDDLTF